MRIIALEYWIVKRVAGQVPGKVTLSVGTYSHATALPDLVVARWDTAGSTWKSEGNFMSSGIATGLITSNNLSSFGAFTIGSTVQHQNPLPVSFIHLREVRTVNGITLLWETAEGSEQGYFDIERSEEGNHFGYVERINAKKVRQYIYNHTEGVSKDHFVRIRWVPKNGDHVYSNPVYVKGFTPAFEVVKIYPSIIIDAATMIISSEGNEEVHFSIRDINGKTVISQRHFLHKGKNVISVAARSLQVGIYFLTIRNKAGRTLVIRFFKT